MDEVRLEKYAAEVIQGYKSANVPLTDGVVKVAEARSLNEEQVRRLVERVNNDVFQHHFKQAEEAKSEDRNVTFEPANPDSVLTRLINSAKDAINPTPEDSAASDPMDLIGDLPNGSDAAGLGEPEKTASAPEEEPLPSKAIVITRLRKAAGEMRIAETQARSTLTDAMQKLARHFTFLDNKEKFAGFERDAVYHRGNDAAPYLALTRRALRMPRMTYDATALHKVARVVDTNTTEMRLLDAFIAADQEVARLHAGVEKMAAYEKQAGTLTR